MQMTADNVLPEIQEAIGAQAPLGFWDPAGFMKDCDFEQFEAVRERELKHGRRVADVTIYFATHCQRHIFPCKTLFLPPHIGFAC